MLLTYAIPCKTPSTTLNIVLMLFNPSGGLGLTGGIVDVGNLYDCLIDIYNNKATDDILVKYSEVRRDKYEKIVDPVSSSNMRRMFDDPDTVMETDDFMKMCKKAETDPGLACEIQKVCVSCGFANPIAK